MGRHPGEGRNPDFRGRMRNELAVIPARAGIQVLHYNAGYEPKYTPTLFYLITPTWTLKPRSLL